VFFRLIRASHNVRFGFQVFSTTYIAHGLLQKVVASNLLAKFGINITEFNQWTTFLKEIGCSDAANSNEFDTEVVDSKLGFELSGSYEEKVSKLTEDAKKMIPLDLTNPDKLVANIKGFATALFENFFFTY